MIRDQRIVKRDFIVRQTEVFATLAGGVQLFCQLDQFLNHFLRGNGAVVIRIERLLELFAEQQALHEVPAGREMETKVLGGSNNRPPNAI